MKGKGKTEVMRHRSKMSGMKGQTGGRRCKKTGEDGGKEGCALKTQSNEEGRV